MDLTVMEGCVTIGLVKTCSRCQEGKPLSAFYASTSGTRGLRYSSACKDCSRSRAAELRQYSNRWQRRMEAEQTGTKWCPRCEEFKPLSEFGTRRRNGVEAGTRAYCHSCEADYRKKYFHGIEFEEYDAMLVAQEYRCGSCRTPFEEMDSKQINIDHCHRTGQVRSVLCHHCNLALGHLKDDPGRIRGLLTYLDGCP